MAKYTIPRDVRDAVEKENAAGAVQNETIKNIVKEAFAGSFKYSPPDESIGFNNNNLYLSLCFNEGDFGVKDLPNMSKDCLQKLLNKHNVVYTEHLNELYPNTIIISFDDKNYEKAVGFLLVMRAHTKANTARAEAAKALENGAKNILDIRGFDGLGVETPKTVTDIVNNLNK